MVALVVGASVASAWCFPDEKTEFTNGVLRITKDTDVVIPELWKYEVCNSVLFGVQRKRISYDHAIVFLTSLKNLRVKIIGIDSFTSLFKLARDTNLTIYDAAYLDLALREKIPLATLDNALSKAATEAGVRLFQL